MNATHQPLLAPNRVCRVQLKKDDRWVRLLVQFASEFKGGSPVRFADGAVVALDGVDELSSNYGPENWLSGLVSGALYAYRTLRIPRQYVVVSELSGRLKAVDMDALATCAALAISRLTETDLPGLAMDGWDVRVEVIERPHLTHADSNGPGPDPVPQSNGAIGTVAKP